MSRLRWLGLVGFAGFVIAAFSPLVGVLNSGWLGRARIEPAAAIVVLGRGGADTDGVLTNRSLRRTLYGIDLFRQGLAPIVVFSGSAAEIAARARLARGLGVPRERVLVAPAARTTREEAVALTELLELRDRRRVLLVVDPIDMPRARATLERAGLAVLPAPTASSGPGRSGIAPRPPARHWRRVRRRALLPTRRLALRHHHDVAGRPAPGESDFSRRLCRRHALAPPAPASLLQAGARALDCAGLTVVFLVANVTLGVAVILGLRAVTGQFVSVYLINDASLAVLSIAQAVFFRWWRELPR